MIKIKYLFFILCLIAIFVVSYSVGKNDNKREFKPARVEQLDSVTDEISKKIDFQDDTEEKIAESDFPIVPASAEVSSTRIPVSQNDLLRHIVKVTCSSAYGTETGSGVIQVSGNQAVSSWHVYTNAHVVAQGLESSGSCIVSVPTAPDYYPSISFDATIDYVSIDLYPDIDFAILKVDSTLPFFDFPYTACDISNITIGDSVIVYGYPGSGGETLTVTEGIVSGFTYTGYGPIIKTSAKIDTGNSGGIAINRDKNCSVGIPTWAVVGDVEGLGFIQTWDIIYESGAL